jgi:hypothetical protein
VKLNERRRSEVGTIATPLGQFIYDLGFKRLKDRTIARKHGMHVQTVRDCRAAFDRGIRKGRSK